MLYTLLFTLQIINGVFSKNCFDYEECEGNAISGSDANCFGFLACEAATIDTTEVYCTGYKACNNAKEITSSTYVKCNGQMGCYEVSSISAQENVICGAKYSCYGSSIETSATTQCNGKYSCSETTIVSDNVYCNSDYSCYLADITAGDYVYAYGHYTTYDSTIAAEIVYIYGYYSSAYASLDSTDELSMDTYCYGYYGGYGSEFICRSGSTCKIYCLSNCCYNMDFICLSGATCKTYCSGVGVDCPYVTISLSATNDIKSFKYLENKKINRINDKVYQEIEAESKRNKNEISQEIDSFLLLQNSESTIITTNPIENSTMVIIAFLMFAVAFIINYCYFSIKFENKEYYPIN